MERFFVGYRLKNRELEEYYLRITAELEEKFKIKNLGNRVKPHFTLKAPFETGNLEKFEKILEDLAKKQESIPFAIEGFGYFTRDHGNTIFLEAAENPELQDAVQDIVDEIRDFGEDKRSLPEEIKLHVSIARYMDDGQFKEAWSYLRAQASPKFNLNFDNLTLFRYFPGGWEIYREFDF